MAVTARPHARAAHSLVLPRRRARCTGGARSAARLEGPAWWAQARARGGAVGAAAAALGSGPTDAEREDWARRAAEAGGNNDSGEWSWTLNWCVRRVQQAAHAQQRGEGSVSRTPHTTGE
mmetsp:Transcript_11635/g.35980  ORF Transcript_11635/g.35980 Transcript_11635/m.35980 type:complete len:120 (+) Transcript_11635:75-434(+)